MLTFTNDDYKNLHLAIIGSQLRITVTLNIMPEMAPYLPKGTTQQSTKRLVYFRFSLHELRGMNEKRILSIANSHINMMMVDCRVAKKKVLDQEIRTLGFQVRSSFQSNT